MELLDRLFALRGKRALITGASSGIGRMIATALVQVGARVLIVSRNGEACAAVAREINDLGGPGSAEGFAGDVGTEAGVAGLVAETGSRVDALDILVNNAGRTWGAKLEEFPYEKWEAVNAVNVAGLFTLTQRLLPLLKAAATHDDPARVLNLGSSAGLQPMGDGAYAYSVSKAAVHHLTKILAKELAEERITVNALAPGPFQSRMTRFATADVDKREALSRQMPLGRIGREEDICAAALFVLGRGGAHTTGAIIPVDGGLSVEGGRDIYGFRGQTPAA